MIDGPRSWLNAETPVTLFLGIVVAEVWRATAIVLVILVAGLQLIPKEYGEAAEVFGASPWVKFRKITLPLLKPSLQSALILRTVLAFEVFAVVYALGGRNMPVLVGEAYVWQRDNQNYGVAAAYAVLIMVISLAATVVYLKRAARAAGAAAMIALRRTVYVAGVVVLCAWVLVPIYLVALGAFGGRLGAFKWPKTILPTDASLAAFMTFLRIEGVWNAALNSLIAAGFTMLFSIALGAPAGYALARYTFRGQDAFRLLVLLTRAFPLAILALPLTVLLHPRRALRHAARRQPGAHRARAALRRAGHREPVHAGIPRELEEAAWVFGCTRAAGVPQGRRAAGAAGARRRPRSSPS